MISSLEMDWAVSYSHTGLYDRYR